MNKWLKRDFEYDDGPLEGEVGNPSKKLKIFGKEDQVVSKDLKQWMEWANMSFDGTSDENNDTYFNDMDENDDNV